MSRYIDADALREKMYHEAFETDTEEQKWDSGCWIRYKMFEAAIEAAPTADVRENVHGKWKTTPYTDDDNTWECTACGNLFTFDVGTPKDNGAYFCPTCGAKLD